jgi:phosphoribosyl 1,2-cyclic phosphodiesterase
MELRFWGVRGTCPIWGKSASRIGGHTPCVSVTSRRGDLVVIDAGTGIRGFGASLRALRGGRELRCSLLLTHFHLDHIGGLPFFGPLFSPETRVAFFSAHAPAESRHRLNRLMGRPYFPVSLDETPSEKTFRKIGRAGVRIGGLRVSACPVHHPQGAVAYRIAEGRSSFVYATDSEPLGPGGMDPRLARFAAGAGALIYDTTFTPEEYESGKKGWGHGTWVDAVRTATAAGVGTLLFTHFNPDHSDRDLALMERKARKAFPDASCAHEGLRLRF